MPNEHDLPAVIELLARVATERGIDFEPTPSSVVNTLPTLIDLVDGILDGLDDPQERRWLAAALAALSHHVQATTVAEVPGTGRAITDQPDANDGGVALAVVTSPRGVLAGCRRAGIPRWVFPGGRIEEGESPAETAARECAEETGLPVSAGHEIGRRAHPVTGELLTYVACTPTAGLDAHVAAPRELVEVRWLDRAELDALIPDLFDAVHDHLDQHSDNAPR